MPPRRRQPTSPPANPLDDENLLAEFLLRLPPRPSSLPRAAAVCKAWRRVVTDPHFLHRFRAHHRKAPLLGFFDSFGRFFATLEAPDRVPLSVSMVGWKVVAYCDGLLLYSQESKLSLRVLDPMTGDRSAILTREYKLPYALAFELVVDSTGLDDLSFRVFVLSMDDDGTRLTVAVYSSDSGAWTHSVETLVTQCASDFNQCPGTIVGNAFYWTHTCRILQYNLETQTLAIIKAPWNEEEFNGYYVGFQAMTKDGHLGIKSSNGDEPTILGLWETDLSSPEKSVMRKIVLLDTLLPLQLQSPRSWLSVIGFDKENSVVFLWTTTGIFMINLESMKFTKVSEETNNSFIYPYSSFATTAQFGMTPEEVVSKIMANPEVAVAFQNPKIQTAIMDCSQNPLNNIVKYQNDKEVMDVFIKLSEMFHKLTAS